MLAYNLILIFDRRDDPNMRGDAAGQLLGDFAHNNANQMGGDHFIENSLPSSALISKSSSAQNLMAV